MVEANSGAYARFADFRPHLHRAPHGLSLPTYRRPGRDASADTHAYFSEIAGVSQITHQRETSRTHPTAKAVSHACNLFMVLKPTLHKAPALLHTSLQCIDPPGTRGVSLRGLRPAEHTVQQQLAAAVAVAGGLALGHAVLLHVQLVRLGVAAVRPSDALNKGGAQLTSRRACRSPGLWATRARGRADVSPLPTHVPDRQLTNPFAGGQVQVSDGHELGPRGARLRANDEMSPLPRRRAGRHAPCPWERRSSNTRSCSATCRPRCCIWTPCPRRG
jgi:hypothetical protein